MGNSPFPELNPAPGPSAADDPFRLKAYAAPNGTTTLVAPAPEILAVLQIVTQIREKTKALRELADHVAEGTQELTRVRGAIRALATLADTMERRRPLNPDADPKCEGFQSTAKNLLDSFFKAPKFKTAIDIRAIDEKLAEAVTLTKTELWGLLKDPANAATFKTWAAKVDKSGDWSEAPADGKLSGVGFAADLFLGISPILRDAIDALRAFESEAELVEMTESIASAAEGSGSDDTLLHVAVKEAGEIIQKNVAGTAGIASQVIGADGLYLRLLETYAIKWLPKAAVSKADAAKTRRFLLKAFLRATGVTGKAENDFQSSYVKVAKAQIEVRWHKTTLERAKPERQAEAKNRLDDAEKELHEAEEHLSKQFLEDPHERIEKARTQGTIAWKSAMAILGAIQLYDAYSDYSEAKSSLDIAKLLSDMAGAGLQITTLSFDITVGLLAKAGMKKGLNLAIARNLLSHFQLKYEAESLAKIAPTGVAIFALLSGVLQFVQGMRDDDAVLKWQGGIQSVAGGFQVYAFRLQSAAGRVAASALDAGVGAAAGEGAAGTVGLVLVVGDALAIVAFAIGVGSLIWEVSKPGSQVISEAIVKYLRQDQKWGYGTPQNFVEALGLSSVLDDVEAMMGGLNWFNIPLDPSPDSDKLLERKQVMEYLKAGGLSDEMADKCVESA